MKTSVLPKTKFGVVSVASVLVFLILVGILNLLRRTLMPAVEITYSGTPLLSIIVVMAVFAAGVAFITGLIAVIKKKDRSILVYIATLFGLFVLLTQD